MVTPMDHGQTGQTVEDRVNRRDFVIACPTLKMAVNVFLDQTPLLNTKLVSNVNAPIKVCCYVYSQRRSYIIEKKTKFTH